MEFRLRRRECLGAGAAAAAALAWPALAASDKPIRIVVTFAAGGASDIVARVIGEQLAKKLGQPVIVDNRPGAGGSVGGTAVAQSPPDGTTLMLSNSTPISIGPFALDKQPYDPVADFTHIALIARRRASSWPTRTPASTPSSTSRTRRRRRERCSSARAARRRSATSTAS
jgi:tripartite-type tricarboxylate transporter receptor subunit TctC